jgi:hypothetical protein
MTDFLGVRALACRRRRHFACVLATVGPAVPGARRRSPLAAPDRPGDSPADAGSSFARQPRLVMAACLAGTLVLEPAPVACGTTTIC